MAGEPKAKQPPAPAAPQGAYAAWKQRVAALIESKGPFSGILRERGIRRLCIAGATPEAAADEAETIAP